MTHQAEHADTPPSALLLIAPRCPHCASVLQNLSELVKEGVIGNLEITNVAARPERASELGVRSVPWTRIGSFVFEGAMSVGELREWAAGAHTMEGRAAYLKHLLTTHRLNEAEQRMQDDPAQLPALLYLLSDPDTSMHARIGIDSLITDLAGSKLLAGMIVELGQLSKAEDVHIRGDACHYLGLTGSPDARPYLLVCAQDQHPDVAEIARESLAMLEDTGAYHG